MLKVTRLVLAFLMLFASAGVANAQSIHTLQGKVITPSGTQPANPVMVTLTFSGRPIYETFTDLSGRFSFTALSRGTYKLTAEDDRQTFETTSVYAEVAAFGSAPQLFTQDIQLRPNSAKPLGQPGVVNALTQNVPKAARLTLERAAKLNRELKTEAAIEQLLEAIRIFPEYFEAHLELGNTFLKAGRFEHAIAECQKCR